MGKVNRQQLVKLILIFGLFFKIYLTRILVFNDYNIINFLVKETWVVLLFLLIIVLAKNEKKEKYLYLIFNFIFSVVLLTIITYNNYFGNLITYKALLQFNQIGGIKLSILDLIEPVAIFLFIDIVLVFLLKDKTKRILEINKLFLFSILILSLSTALYVNKTTDTKEIVNENIKAEKMGIFNYQLYKYIDGQFLTVSAVTGISDITNNNLNWNERQMFGTAKDKNIIFIQLEAIQNFAVGLQVDGKEITPNLNKLLTESIYFPHFYQQIGTGSTSDAEFVANTSIHPIGDVSMSYVIKDIDVPSLPRVLNSLNYETVTFHTNDVGFWDRNYMYNSLDFDRYYDDDYFGEEDFISFGSSDEILYEKTLTEMVKFSELGQKYYANVISMSSHHPYLVPEEYYKISLPEEFDNTKIGRYLYAVNYADYALGLFIEGLKEKGIYEDTMLVIYGDHYAIPIEDENDEELYEKITNSSYSEYIDKYNIPLIIKTPGQKQQMTIDLVGGQVDIMPTVLNLLGLDPNNYHLYGKDLLNSESNIVPIRYYLPSGSFVNNEIFYIPGEGFEDGYAIDFKTKEPIEDISKYKDDYDKTVRLLESSDDYIKKLVQDNEEKEKNS